MGKIYDKNRVSSKHKKKKKRSSSSSSSSSLSSLGSIDEKTKRKLKKKLKKLKKKEKLKKSKKKSIKKEKGKAILVLNEDRSASTSCDVDVTLMEKSKSLAPMTKEEWEKQQNTFKRVFDEETGRMRLMKGTGEIVEECVSRDRHLAINKQATKGDGEFFQRKLLQQIK